VQRFGYVESSGFMNYRMISSVMQTENIFYSGFSEIN
jgi:hypothetical protein